MTALAPPEARDERAREALARTRAPDAWARWDDARARPRFNGFKDSDKDYMADSLAGTREQRRASLEWADHEISAAAPPADITPRDADLDALRRKVAEANERAEKERAGRDTWRDQSAENARAADRLARELAAATARATEAESRASRAEEALAAQQRGGR